jgi:hypothetical protein
MNALAVRRREDVALVAAWARAVYRDAEFTGRVHRIDAGWLAEGADGRTLGSYPTERLAVGAVLDGGRRG